eukprot:CAMPEP_0170592268 /NCGR_PEP_ID=MMETSP0224-20130122/12837_1 /TAXON_ID=285029 /ORGANISM="Togula jolla, Strain CCCM 725" /LENGTH=721 /DNA_ID=CAMNT_0010916169 /DNA_START=44 /DNA_END=2209 /DNA_ORIENTATION=+
MVPRVLAAAWLLALAIAEPAFNPLKKVVTMLEEMKEQVQKEADEDLAAYDKYSCWCTNGEKEKTAAIESATSQIDELTSANSEGLAKEGELKTMIGELAASIEEDKNALATATAIREKEKETYLAEAADMNETLVALDQAVEVLSKVQLLQKQGKPLSVAADDLQKAQQATAALLQVRHSVQRRFPEFREVMQKDLFDVLGSLSGGGRQTVFLSKQDAAPAEAAEEGQPAKLEGAAAGAKSYNSRSGTILGVLSEMKDEFGRDLAEATATEEQAEAAFQQLREAKEAEISVATEQKGAKEAELSQLLATMASAKEDIAALEEATAADQRFLEDLKENCKSEEEEHSSRVAARAEEVKALSEALKILREDDARALFGKTMSFIQVSASAKASQESRLQEQAMQRIAEVARKNKNWALVSLAVRVQLDSFKKVQEAMDKMMAELKKQQQEEYEKRDMCEKEIDSLEDQVKDKNKTAQDLAHKHTGLSNALEVLNSEIAQLKAEVSEMEVSLKQAGEQRRDQNAMFQSSISDQRATIEILKKTLDRLKQFYTPAALVEVHSHLQKDGNSTEEEEGPVPGAAFAPPPAKGKDFQKSAGAGGVIQLIMDIIKDAEITEQDVEKSEQKAQADYAAYVSDTSASIQADRDAIAKKEEEAATAEGEKSETEAAQLSNTEESGKLLDMLKAQHLDCDFLLKYFDVRQTARAEEMDAIKDAKAILSGADFS